MTMKTPPDALFFKGRSGDPRLGEFFLPLNNLEITTDKKPTLTIIGAPDDTGVTLNRGRPGASAGPDAIRAAFYKFAVPTAKSFDRTRFLDAGNIIPSSDIVDTHSSAFAAARAVTQAGSTLIALGGGHDFAAPHILGAFAGLKPASKQTRRGVINVDPHLDVRELENNKPHSGTPFRQILESGTVKGSDLIQFGARDGRNARAHFAFCASKKVPVHEFASIRAKGDAVRQFNTALTSLAKRCHDVAITIDMDCCAGIEGVSAAPVIGFSPWELCQFAYVAGKNSKVRLLELAEVAPDLDPSGRAPRIAAEVLFHFLLGLLQRRGQS